MRAILAARIDRLPGEKKDLLQTLAVMGKEFPLGLIRKVTATSEGELEQMLGDLQLGEFIYEQPALPDVEYTFKHALTQQVAYDSVLQVRRKALHGRAAAAIEALYADRMEDYCRERQPRQGCPLPAPCGGAGFKSRRICRGSGESGGRTSAG